MSDGTGELTNLIWIAALGKLLVRKGVLSREEIIEELRDLQTMTKGYLLDAEIDQMVRAVERWQ